MDYQRPHTHRWNFLMTKTAFVPVSTDSTQYNHVEYAYLICNGPHDNHQPIVVKVPIEKLDEVDFENPKS
jgi:hypothetical protein